MSHPKFDPSAVLPKSILKKINEPDKRPVAAAAAAAAAAVVKEQPAPPSSARDQRNREIALYHANLIQQQKEVEAKILDAIIQLLEFPSSPDADPDRPSDADASQFLSLITDFQPSDYDSLIEERKCADLCGYALCPKPPIVEPNGGKKRFIIGKGRELKILPREKVELWCSEDCARRALYVKVQLSEEPAWLRRGGIAEPLELLVEKSKAAPEAEAPQAKTAYDDEYLNKAMSDLALERGEQHASAKSFGLVGNTIIERDNVAPASAPTAEDLADSIAHMAIEGYEPRMHSKDGLKNNGETQDWDI